MHLKIREQRKKAGLSIRELGKITGIGKDYISKIENGLSIPSIYIICKIAKGLKLGLAELVEFK